MICRRHWHTVLAAAMTLSGEPPCDAFDLSGDAAGDAVGVRGER